MQEERTEIPFVEGLIHKTKKEGLIVRSKSEVIIAKNVQQLHIKARKINVTTTLP